MADGGVYRGNRVDGADYFDDVMTDNTVPEMFRGGGMESLEDVKSQASPAGMILDMHCRPPGCGSKKRVIVEWPELFIISQLPKTGAAPPGWRRSDINNAVIPELTCQRCGAPVAPVITYDWAHRQLNAALQQGLTSVQALNADPRVQQLQHAMQARQQQY